MALVKPTEVVLWAVGGDKVSPSLGKRDDGWVFGEKPGHDHMNFIQNNFGLWLNYVNDLGTFENTASGGSTFGSLGWGEDLNDVEGSVIIGNKSAQGSHAETILIGHKSLQNSTNSQQSIVIGNNSGNGANVSSSVLIGAGVESADNSVFIGNGSGNAFSPRSVGIGVGSGNFSGVENVCVGDNSGSSTAGSAFVIAIGNQAGWNLVNSQGSVIIGSYTGTVQPFQGDGNVFIGKQAGSVTDGSASRTLVNNVIAIGNGSGKEALVPDGSVLIGTQVGGNAYSYGADAMLLIGFGNTATPLIEGNITNPALHINGILSGNEFKFPELAPASPVAGHAYFSSGSNTLFIHNGAGFASVVLT